MALADAAFPQYRKAPKKAEKGEKLPHLSTESKNLLKQEKVKLSFALNRNSCRTLIGSVAQASVVKSRIYVPTCHLQIL